MFECLYSWEFWVCIVIVFILTICVMTYCIKADDEHEEVKHRPSPRDATVVSEYAVERTMCEESIYQDLTPRLPVQFMKYSTTKDVYLDDDYEVDIPLPEHITNPEKRPKSTKPPSEPTTKGEIACKIAAEKIWGVPFHSTWPEWLKSPKGYPMQIDLYNEKLKIGIEYNGVQHYKYTPYFHKKGPSDFEYQKQKDELKLETCDKYGVYIISVPYHVPLDMIEEYIRYYDPVAYSNRMAREDQLRRY